MIVPTLRVGTISPRLLICSIAMRFYIEGVL